MISQLFGSKKSHSQVYSKARVRSIDNTQYSAKAENPIEFDVDSVTALNVPTLTPEVNNPPEVQDKAYIKQLVRKRLAALDSMTSGSASSKISAKLNPEEITKAVERNRQRQKEKQSVIPILKNVVNNSQVVDNRKTDEPSKKGVPGKKIVGIFSDSPCFSDQFLRRTFKECPNISFARFSEYDLKSRQKEIDRVEAWVINLSEEDEHSFLDDFVERIGNLPTLFLFERSASAKCVENVLQFVAESRSKSVKTL